MKKILAMHLVYKTVPDYVAPLVRRKSYLVLKTIDPSDDDRYSEQIYEV